MPAHNDSPCRAHANEANIFFLGESRKVEIYNLHMAHFIHPWHSSDLRYITHDVNSDTKKLAGYLNSRVVGYEFNAMQSVSKFGRFWDVVNYVM